MLIVNRFFKVLLFNKENPLLFDMVKFTVRRHVFNIYGKQCRCQHFVTVSRSSIMINCGLVIAPIM